MPNLASINPLSCGSFFRVGRGREGRHLRSHFRLFLQSNRILVALAEDARPCSQKVNLPCGTKASEISIVVMRLPPSSADREREGETDFHCIFDTPSPFRVDKEPARFLSPALHGDTYNTRLDTGKKKALKVSSPKTEASVVNEWEAIELLTHNHSYIQIIQSFLLLKLMLFFLQ